MSPTWMLSSDRPTLNASSWIELARRLQHGQERPADVLDVDQRAPRRAVALQPDLPVVIAIAVRLFTTMSSRSRGEAPYAVALRRYVGLKVSSASFGQLLLGQRLGLAVRRDREHLGVLGDGFGAGRAVQAAGRREHEPLDARVLGRRARRSASRRRFIEYVAALFEMPERVVGQRGQADHRVVPRELRGRDVPDVPRLAAPDRIRARPAGRTPRTARCPTRPPDAQHPAGTAPSRPRCNPGPRRPEPSSVAPSRPALPFAQYRSPERRSNSDTGIRIRSRRRPDCLCR